MLDRTFIVPHPESFLDKNLIDILKGLKNEPEKTLEVIISLSEYPEGAVGIFSEAIACIKNIQPHVERLAYEAFLRIIGFEELLRETYRNHGISERHTVFCRMSNAVPGEFLDTSLWQGCAIVAMAKRRVEHSVLNDEMITILAYTIATFYKKELDIYDGTCEIYYLIDHIRNIKNGHPVEMNLLAWALNAKPMQSVLLYIECDGFLVNELCYARDMDLVERVIILRHSHQLLLHKLEPIIKYLAWRRGTDRIFVRKNGAFILSADTANRLTALMVASYNRLETSCTDDILMRLAHEGITKAFVRRTGFASRAFYRICMTVDADYAEAVISCLQHFSSIGLAQLYDLAASPFFPYITRQMSDFRIIVNELVRRQVPFSAERLFSSPRGKRHIKTDRKGNGEEAESSWLDNQNSILEGLNETASGISLNKTSSQANQTNQQRVKSESSQAGIDMPACENVNTPCLSKLSLRSARHSDIEKLYYLVNNGIKIKRSRFLASMDPERKVIVLKVFFALADAKLIRRVHEFAGELLLDALSRITKYSMFYVRVANYLADTGANISGLAITKDRSTYGRVLCGQIRGAALGMQEPMASVRQLEEGLLFLNSYLHIRNDNHRFTLTGCFTVEWNAASNILLHFDGDVCVFIKYGIVYLQSGTSGATVIYTVKNRRAADDIPGNEEGSQPRQMVRQANEPGTEDSSMPSNMGEGIREHIYLNIKCIYTQRQICISVNGQEQRLKCSRIGSITIDGSYSGWINNLVYFQSNARFCAPECLNDIEYYRNFILPLQSLLKYRQRAGVLINGARPFILNGKIHVTLKNIVEHRQPRQIPNDSSARVGRPNVLCADPIS